MACPLITQNGATKLMVKLTPGASANKIAGGDLDLFGEFTLKVMVTAIPEKGEANAALLKVLSKALGLAKSSITIEVGNTSRVKILALLMAPEVVWEKLQPYL